MAEILTHTKIDKHLCGTPVAVGGGVSQVVLTTSDIMAADHFGLVHGGFIFALADYAAMLAVNDPNVVLGGADVKFLKPVKVGQTIEAQARIIEQTGKKCIVSVSASRDAQEVFYGEFTCFVLERHVLAG